MTKFFEHETSSIVDTSIIWLHGLGASGRDLGGIVNSLKLKEEAKVRYIFPDAPKIPVTINSNQIMRAWYDITGMELTDRQDISGIYKSEKLISELIHSEFERGISYSNIFLAGFSQGCAMALFTGIKFPERLAGIIALSGYLPLVDVFKRETFKTNLKTPIFFGHGDLDEVVKPEWGKSSCSFLKQLGYLSYWNNYEIDHSICSEEINDISSFINRYLT